MSIIERYVVNHSAGARACEASRPAVPGDIGKRCVTEVILHTRAGEKYFCREHAAHELRDDPTMLAAAVLDLYLQ